MNKSSNVKDLLCEYCGKSRANFSTNSNYHKHVASHVKIFKCKSCEKMFGNKDILNQHKKIVHDQRGYQCEECKKFFQLKGNLKRHMSVHKVQMIKHSCVVCGKEFNLQSDLNHHLKQCFHPLPTVYCKPNNNNENEIFKCDYCDNFIM